MELTAPITAIKGIGEKTAARFAALGIVSVQDLLLYFPRDYMAYEQPLSTSKLSEEEGFAAVEGVVQGRPVVRFGNQMKITVATIRDDAGSVQALWFNMPYLASTLKAGTVHVFRGRVQRKGNRVTLLQPEVFSPADYEEKQKGLHPMYALTKGVSNQAISKALAKVFANGIDLPETLSVDLIERQKLLSYRQAICQIHFPENETALRAAHRRLVFDEFFHFFLAMEAHKLQAKEETNGVILKPDETVLSVIRNLPYTLTDDQQKAWQEICADFAGKHCMHRMLQGDVGSGKTILAVLGCFTAASGGWQSTIMAPTEVLAVQHYENVTKLVETNGLPYHVGLLVGSLTAAAKRRMQERIALGLVDIVIGTHAVIQDAVSFAKLGFVVTDEQHRFGVHQRETLAQKGAMPHVLVMSATPIPRTLALLLYGDLDLSVIRQMPAERIPIKNCVIHQDKRESAYRFIEKQVAAGRQAYVICPMVEESEMLEGENVLDYTKKLRKALPSAIRLGTLHGRMKPTLKNEVMEAFAAGEIDVLVSTTVVEVGIDVPNATVMLIENADRFGLSQLHQLRGRVGRGKEASYCIFVSGSNKEEVSARLKVISESNDGFYISEQDLKLRGPGELFGLRQSGALAFRIGDIIGDSDVLYQAKEETEALFLEDPQLNDPQHALYAAFMRQMDANWTL